MTKTKAGFLVAAILFHFAVILVGITRPKVNGQAPFWYSLGWYGKITGASASYSFFSPDIPREVMFHFVVHRKDKSTFETTLQQLGNNEVNARLGNILRMIPRNYKDRKIVRSMAASVTASVFNAFPEAEVIDLKSTVFLLPSMDEYREGKRTTIKPIYSASFAKGPGV